MSTKRKDPLTNLLRHDRIGKDRKIRHEFYEEVLSRNTQKPETDLQNLCAAWLRATGARWVWLWLKHEAQEGQGRESLWELTSAIGPQGFSEGIVPTESQYVALENRRSVAEFCSRLGRPVFIEDIVKWVRKLPDDGEEYTVACVDELRKKGCRSFLSVPLFFATNTSGPLGSSPYSLRGNLRGLVCCHFDGRPPTPLQTEESLLLMGRASSQAIAASFNAAQHRILFELDKLTTQYLTTHTGNIVIKRHDFLMKVINLMKEHLRVQHASVFYKTTDGERVVCLATTGLRNKEGVLPANKMGDARYEKNESITGTVFATGEAFVSQMGKTPSFPGRTTYKWRETPDDVPESLLPWICYPIKTPDSKTVLGVLRCVGNRALLAKNFPRNFDPIQLGALDFISRQLAPVLETLASYINRERVISIIKHDLDAPLKMIEDSIAKADEQLALGKPPNKYFVSDLQCCIHTARSLAQGLDQSPTELREFNPKPTWMEADIVAVIQNMLQHYARFYNNMDIRFNDPERGRISEGFPKKLWLDRNLISRCLTNLIVNAVKYGETGTTIFVSARKVDGRGFYLDVENSGIEISSSEKKRIFEEGYRSPRAEAKAIGLGMGLAIARAIMEKHKGRLDLVSPANPTVFSMFFPFHLVRP